LAEPEPMMQCGEAPAPTLIVNKLYCRFERYAGFLRGVIKLV
jgi:hypothetical protein